MVKFLNWLVEKLMSRSKKPWGRFIVSGVTEDSEVRFDISYNKAFIKNLDKQGLTGITEEETVQNFLFGTMMAPKAMFDEINDQSPIATEAHPNLQSETNVLKR